MKYLFLDESGDHNLKIIDPQYPVFVLGGVIVEESHLNEVVKPRLNKLKKDFLGDESLHLHTADMVRYKKGFEQLKNPAIRMEFYAELNKLMAELKYMVLACVIKKPEYQRRYGLNAVDAYHFSLEVLVERFCYEIGNTKVGGTIIAESRDPILDQQLQQAWSDLQAKGTFHVTGKTIQKRIDALTLKTKKDKEEGLELADLVVSPIGRAVMRKPTKEDWQVIKSKFRSNGEGKVMGYGLVILPK